MRVKGKWICFVIGLLAAAMPTVSVQAGSINDSEQSVISAVSQSFYYNGATYVVKDSYIEEGRSKLSSDDVDLTAAQASEYISQFQGSYQELVEDGYCDKIGDVSVSSDETPEPEHSKKVSKQNSLFLKTIFKDTKKSKDKDSDKDSDKDTEFSGESTKDDGTDGTTQTVATPKADEESWGEEADLGKVLVFDDTDREHAKDNKLTIFAGTGNLEVSATDTSAESTGGKSSATESSKDNLINNLLRMKWWPVACVVASVLTVLSMGAAVWYIKKFKHKKHKNRKLRKWIAVAMGLCSFIWTFFILAVLTLYFGLYNESAIQRQLMESDYFLGVTQMTRELAQDQLEEAGYSRDIAEEVFTLSSVYIEEKQYIEGILKGSEDSSISTDRIQEPLNTEVVKEDGSSDTDMISQLEDTYVNMLQFPMASTIRVSRVTFMKWFYGVIIAGVILVLALFVMTYELYDYLHKSARVYSVAMFVASLILTVAAFVMKMLHLSEQITANPVYYEQFLQKYLSWNINVAFYVGCIGLLASAGLVIWKRYLHMIYAE
jgi:hypothetical protein